MENAERFLERVIPFWAAPDPTRVESFFHPDATIRWLPTLRRPMRPMHLRRIFERVKVLLPDISIECKRWAVRGDVLFAETSITATFAGQALGWGTIDLFVVRDGRAAEQLVYFDEVPLRALVDPSAIFEGLDLGQGER